MKTNDMNENRRVFLKNASLLIVGAKLGLGTNALTQATEQPAQRFKRIAIEEAFLFPEMRQEFRALLERGAEDEPGFRALYESLIIDTPEAKLVARRLADVGEGRIAAMDASQITMQVLSVTAPGVQIFDAAKAVDLAKKTNDQLAAAVQMYPERFAGLATIAPQNPGEAARELDRAVTELGMKGALINSHTKGEYLDLQKYWDIFEAMQALDVPLYIHPRTPPANMLEPYLAYALESSSWGFAAETALHALRLIHSGLFDRFERLKIILGHMGEGIPYWLSRLDNRYAWWRKFDTTGRVRKLEKTPSEYFKENFRITTSGMTWHPVLSFCHQVLGADNILFAVDYPYESADEAVAFMDSAPLAHSDKEKIYHLNAEELFKLGTTQAGAGTRAHSGAG